MASITASVVASSIAASLDGDNVAVAVADPSVQINVSPQPVIAAAGSVNSIGPVAVSVTPGVSQPGAAAAVLRITGGTVSPLVLEVEQQVVAA
jgi:hypothetical protein